MFRNYRADQGKWQTADPLGYPDGWNNFAYCNNGIISTIDWMGGWEQAVHHDVNATFLGSNTTVLFGGEIINVLSALNRASDIADSQTNPTPAYQHAMSDPGQTTQSARYAWETFIDMQIKGSLAAAALGRSTGDREYYA